MADVTVVVGPSTKVPVVVQGAGAFSLLTKTATDAAASSSANANAAALSATAAQVASPIYPDTVTGLASTAANGYFNVVGNGSVFATLYRKVSGAAVFQTSYPSKAAFDTAFANLAGSDGASGVGFTQSGANSQARPIAAKAREALSVTDKVGSDTTGATASDAALASALTQSYADKNRPVRFPTGTYKMTGKATVTQGVALLGDGSGGSNEAYGTVINHASTGDCIEFNGAGAAFAGTGGAISDLLLVKADGFQGGSAIKLVATNDSQRPGEMVIDHVLTYGVGNTAGAGGPGGLWAKGLFIDGSACNTAGSRGVRSVRVNNCRFAEATTPNKTVHLKQVSHFYSLNMAIDQGDATSPQGLYLEGINDRVFNVGANIGGTVIIVPKDALNATTNWHFHGAILSSFVNNDIGVNGSLVASFEESGGQVLVNKSKSLVCLTNINPDFALTGSAPVVNVTGDGTTYLIPWNTEKRDRGNLISGPVTKVTIQCTGTYDVRGSVTASGLGAAHVSYELNIVHEKAAGGSDTYTSVGNPGVIRNGGNFLTLDICRLIACEFGDTLAISIVVGGGAKTVGVYHASGPIYSTFAAKYLP